MATSASAVLSSGYVVTPPGFPSASFSSTGGQLGNGNYRYGITYVTVNGESGSRVASSAAGPGSATGSATLTNIAIGPVYVIGRRIYRTTAGGVIFFLLTTINDNTTTTYVDTAPDSSLGTDRMPAINTSGSISTVLGTFRTDSLVQKTMSASSVAGFASVICDGSACQVTFTGLTTAAATTATAVITNRNVTANSLVHVTIQSYTGTWVTNGCPIVVVNTVTNGSVTLRLTNIHATNALSGTLVVYIDVTN